MAKHILQFHYISNQHIFYPSIRHADIFALLVPLKYRGTFFHVLCRYISDLKLGVTPLYLNTIFAEGALRR